MTWKTNTVMHRYTHTYIVMLIQSCMYVCGCMLMLYKYEKILWNCCVWHRCVSVRLSVCRCLPATKEDKCEGGFKEQEHVSKDALEKSRFMLTIPLWSCIESVFNRSQKMFLL